jgi:hypothetical protein
MTAELQFALIDLVWWITVALKGYLIVLIVAFILSVVAGVSGK